MMEDHVTLRVDRVEVWPVETGEMATLHASTQGAALTLTLGVEDARGLLGETLDVEVRHV